jgi:hypothetical protein
MQDTHPDAQKVLTELWRKASPTRKFSLIFDTTRALQEFILAGLRERYKGESPAKLRRRFADAWLGPDLARKAYGPFPDDSKRG